jgi:diaminopimelate decarboxylase
MSAPAHPAHSPSPYFQVADDELVVGGIGLRALAQRVGRTPFFVYDRQALDARIDELRSVLPAAIQLHYAIKANPMPAVVTHVAARVDGLDVASGEELEVALATGTDALDISFAGPGKSEAELARAVAAGILINVESFRELRVLDAIAKTTNVRPRVAVRVNPDFELKSSGMKMSGGPRQFGIDAEQVPQALADITERGLGFEGFHIFSGSQNLRHQAICEAHAKAYELAIALAQNAPAPVLRLNLGGGLGIPYFPGELPLELAPVADNLAAIAHRAAGTLPGAKLMIELGRYLVGEAGLYVCKVLDRKISRGHVFLVTDGGLHHHLAASGNFGQVIRKNYPVAIGNRMRGDQRETASVVGRLCTPLDLLADRMDLARAEEGDLVVIFQSGAYGRSASPAAFLSHPPAAEVLVG